MNVTIFFEKARILMKISEIQKKIEKKSFVFKIIVSELVELICLY